MKVKVSRSQVAIRAVTSWTQQHAVCRLKSAYSSDMSFLFSAFPVNLQEMLKSTYSNTRANVMVNVSPKVVLYSLNLMNI